MEQNMVQGLSTHFGGLYIYIQVGYNLLLSGEIVQPLGADNSFKFAIFAVCRIVRIKVGHGSGSNQFKYKYSFYF